MAKFTTRGSTLALAYAQTHPDRVQALILRGIFLFRRKEIDFFWRTGTRCELPDHLIHGVLISRVLAGGVVGCPPIPGPR